MKEANRIPVVSNEEFARRLALDAGLLSHSPFVVEGFIEQWPAYSDWNNLDFLADRFGSLKATAGAPQFVTNKNGLICEVDTNYGNYLRYIKSPRDAEVIFEGQWIKGSYGAYKAQGHPLYCGNVQFVSESRSKILSEISPLTPGNMECWNDEIPFYYQIRNHVWLYVGLRNSLTPLHFDNNAVISYLAQLKGSKIATLYSPADRSHYFNEGAGFMDVDNPITADFPSWRDAQPWVGRLEAGQMLIWGADWGHHVATEADSISISLDIVNDCNFEAYTRSREWMDAFGRMAIRRRAVLERHNSQTFLDFDHHGQAWRIGLVIMIRALKEALAQPNSPRSSLVKTRMLSYLLDEADSLQKVA